MQISAAAKKANMVLGKIRSEPPELAGEFRPEVVLQTNQSDFNLEAIAPGFLLK